MEGESELNFLREFRSKIIFSENKVNDAIGYRSPCASLQQYTGSTSPAQGRSVREFEEQMAALHKENFNLKLRLYFIEESIPGYNNQSNNPDGQETLMKQLIDTKVEMEILRKEIQEKQELLQQAAQAFNQMEKIQKDTEQKSQAIIDDLNHKIQYLEIENKEMEKSQTGQLMNELLGRSDVTCNINAVQKIRELEGTVKQSEDKVVEFQEQIHKLDNILTQRDQTIRECEDKVKELIFQNSELLEQLEKKDKEIATAESQRLREELQDQKRQLADKTCILEETEEKLKDRIIQHEQACKTIQKLMLNIKALHDEIGQLKKNNSSLSSQGKETLGSNETALGLLRSFSDTEGVTEIATARPHLEKMLEHKDSEIRKLKSEVKKKTANLQNLVNKELWEKNREIERLTKLINKSNSLPTSPNKETEQLKQSFTDSEYADALERNKSLQRKVDSLIQRLAAPNDRNADSIIKQLKMEVKAAKEETERADKFRKECADVCSILTARLEELAGFLDSLLKHKDVLGILAADRRRAMRKAVDRSLDLSKSLNNMSLSITGLSMMEQSLVQISNISEFLDVSFANKENRTYNSHEEISTGTIEALQAELKALKIELHKTRGSDIKKDRRSLPITFENQSESEAWSEPDRKVSLARIGLEEPRAATKICKEERSTDSESELNQSRSKSKTQEKISQLESIISQKDEKILEIQCELVDADNRLREENARVVNLTKELQELKEHNEKVQDELTSFKQNQESGFDITTLSRQLEEKNRSLSKIQEERDRITIELRIAEFQIDGIKSEMEDMKQKHEAALAQATEQEKQKLNELQQNLNNLMEQRLSEQKEKHEETLARDWIAMCIYEEHVKQFEQLKVKLVEAETTIDYLTENESEMKQSLMNNELSMRALKKNLDETTLQASKAVLERTKALNEKLQLETRTQDLAKQMQALESEKSALLAKITTLEQRISVTRKPSSNHGSDVSQSGYTSEEVPIATGRAHVGGQRVNNSSPDLGIESDAGRISSVELSNTHLTKLKTVELNSNQMINEENANASSGSTVIDGAQQHQPQQKQQLVTPHDCAKVDQENAELRSKLTRTKRALQDTFNKLRTANQRKEQVEKEIKNQILKTHNVLKNVRSNMENEL